MRTKPLELKSWLREYRWFMLLEGLLAASIFFVDLSMELGVAGGVLYVSLVLVALCARQKRYIWGAALLGTTLTVLGYWLSPPGGEFWKVAVNRSLSILLIWGTAIFCYLFKLNEEGLEEVHVQLEQQFKKLAKKDAELEFANRQLEGKITERTQKLQATNLFLEQEVRKNIQAQKELQNTHLRLTTIVNAAGVGVYGLDLDGITTFSNSSGAAMMGYGIEEMVGKNQHELVHHSRPDGSPYPKEECFIYSAFTLGASYRVRDEVFWRKDGTSFPAEYISSPLYEDGVLVGAVVTFKDISAQKHIERERETLLSDLESMNVELKSFAYVVSHDLKEPLRGIIYNSKWLTQDYGETLGEKGKEYLERLNHNTERMYHLINGLLQFSEVGNIRELSTPVRSGSLVEGVIRCLPPAGDIEIEIQGPMPEVVYPPIRLEQVFQNLIANGIKHFGKQKGKVVVSCADIEGFWLFEVWDNGQGIRPQHFDKIFEMFQSLDRRKSSDSTGIGLALVKKIVEQNGGKIQVESEFGSFTRFRFTVPKVV
ncbi:MAG: PAS domain S-box protein [Nitrospinae bacterium]|nr:PAS domain S-box protein [Nitrospinota bacterium]MBL7021171.1 PAS domain S-box protein [Nitrospinaceae bacterium]